MDTKTEHSGDLSNEKLEHNHVDKITVPNVDELLEEVTITHYSPWSPNLLKLYVVLIIPYLCGALNGFDGSLMGAINAMKTYQDYFGM